MAPIDPLQLLKALSPLLSAQGGIRSADEVSRLSSLMKKFSRKLVSRCIYCNVLSATAPDILEVFLELDGWSTIHCWLQEAKAAENVPFLLELLKLCQILPMSLERLKENSTPKLVKGLTKSGSEEVRTTAEKVVSGWMKLIKGDGVKDGAIKSSKEESSKKKEKKQKSSSNLSSPKGSAAKRERSKESTESITAEEGSKSEQPSKKVKPERPKTVKTFQTKFRSTGLEEAALPPPKAGSKKPTGRPPVDKNAVLSARQRLTPTVHTERRVKPSSLVSLNADSTHTPPPPGGIKLIAPKPVHVLQEDGGFMDALTATPAAGAVPGKRKRKPSTAGGAPGAKSTSPTSPSSTPPKFQFYKDTLETGEDETKAKEEKEEEEGIGKGVKRRRRGASKEENGEEEEGSEEGGPPTPTADGVAEEEEAKEGEDAKTEKTNSILSQTRKKAKKTVRWVEDSKLKQFHYFELDETERVNVNTLQNFGEMKSMEMKRERQAVESARRLMGDRMEETIPFTMPRRIDLPEPLVEIGSGSQEREVQKAKQLTTLQEIYFSKEMIPDSPHEPDGEQVQTQDAKTIPLEDENGPAATLDYSHMEVPKASTIVSNSSSGISSSLPPILSNLVMSIAKGPPLNDTLANPIGMPDQQQQHQQQQQMMQNGPFGMAPSQMMPPQGMNMMGPPPQGFDGFPMQGMGGLMGGGPGGDWGMMGPPHEGNDFYGGPLPPMGPMGMGPIGPMGHMMGRGGGAPGPRNRNPRMRNQTPRVPCKYFMTNNCRYGANCTFLHPGFNGPPLP